MTKTAPKTPVRYALREDSPVLASVADGLGAVKAAHRGYFDLGIRPDFADSLDLDAAMQQDYPVENRWDYLLGHATSGKMVAVEPHSAKQGEISTVIRKRTAALAQLKDHLRDGAKISKWLWVASGKVRFAGTEKAKLMLDQNGIEFAGTKVMAKHLPAATPSPAGAKRRRRPRK